MTAIRQPHAPQNLESRKKKGLKIERLLKLNERGAPFRLLEIGTGSGGISNYFGTHPELDCTVESVDVADVRSITDGYTFHLVDGVNLPFTDESFDVVISNHCIEHVGGGDRQLEHLRELYRVMKTEGTGYIALPNRWMLVEPHYKLAFLSWLPRRLRTPYLKLMRRGSFYDCEPLALAELEALLLRAGLKGENLCPDAILETYRIEKPRSLAAAFFRAVPKRVLRMLNPAVPTLIYRLHREA